MLKKIVAIVFLLASVGAGTYFYYQKDNKNTSQSFKTATAKQGTLKISLSLDGKTVIDRRDLNFTVSGQVANIAVVEGQVVKRGQYLMGLDSSDVQKNLEKDLKDFLLTRNSFEQTSQVTYREGTYTDSNDTIKRLLQNNQYNLDKAVLDVEIRSLAIKESKLYSPIDGVVSLINVKQGETVNTQNSTSVITITKPDSLQFEATAEDTEPLKISTTQKTAVKLDAISGVIFPAQTIFISNLANFDQNDLASYKVVAKITDPKSYQLFDGMSGQIQFTTKEKVGVITLPNEAISRDSNQSYVNLLVNDIQTKTEITTGFTDGKDVEIVSGLKVGDQVVY